MMIVRMSFTRCERSVEPALSGILVEAPVDKIGGLLSEV
jgi:hypothetical protein